MTNGKIPARAIVGAWTVSRAGWRLKHGAGRAC